VGTFAKGGKMKHRSIGKLPLAILSLSLLGSASAFAEVDRGHGPDGLGSDGIAALAEGNGNFPLADQIYYRDYMAHPGNPLAIFNMAVSLRWQGRKAEAHRLFSQAAAVGQNYIPDFLVEPHDQNTTIRDAACWHLALDRVSDPNCPGFRTS